jgi:3-hydroxybutyryl-CoA dehydratase
MTGSELAVGAAASFTKTVTEADVVLFAGVTGDFNPAHVDEAWASASQFGGRIAHGMLTASFISTVLAMRLPGPGTIYLSQTLRFTAPVRIGDTVTARVEVAELIPEGRVRLATTVTRGDGRAVVEGEALVLAPLPPA